MQRGVWIPMSEGLPEMTDTDFCYFSSEAVLVLTESKRIYHAQFFRYEDEPRVSVRTADSGGQDIRLETVTHYLYIPEIPKD
jgi:hypothetical protein